MSDISIPSELITIILSHVPAESLFRLRCICKAWCRLIDDPYFRKIHTNHQIQNGSISSNENRIHLLHGNCIYRQSLSISLNQLDHSNHIDSITFENPVITAPCIHTLPLGNGEQCASCNGLILTFNYQKLTDSWSISNPLTKEIHRFPPCFDDIKYGVGFGYDRNKDDYKVVVMHSKGTAFLYSLKSNSWKMIETNSSFRIIDLRPGVFCNGSLHWIGKRLTIQNQNESSEEEADVIVAFDLESEEVRFYSLPCTFFDRRSYGYDLGELGGRLSLTNYLYSGINCSKIWLMDKYGDENSWSMLHSRRDVPGSRPIRYIQNKEILILFKCIYSSLVLIDLKKNNKYIISMKEKVQLPLVFQPSLVRIPNGVRIQVSPQREANNMSESLVINPSSTSKKISQREANDTRGSVDINPSSKSKIMKGLFCCFRKS